MRILLTNDDGCDSEGLHAVADLFKDEHEITVVAPNVQKSGASRSLTLKPVDIMYEEVCGYDYKVYSVYGTPVDCVKVGCTVFCIKPDLVISGINRGQNIGQDLPYSGTVCAALDAVHIGSRAIALSYADRHGTAQGFKACAEFLKKNFDKILSLKLSDKTALNINFPSGKFKGVKIVRANTQATFKDVFVQSEENKLALNGHRDRDGLDPETDERYISDGYITITPITVDFTDHAALDRISKETFDL